MNANEVLAHRANSLLAAHRGTATSGWIGHDDVNRGQSSNDVIPTALHVATAVGDWHEKLLPALRELQAGGSRRGPGDFDAVVKTGRTHLQDATPIRLGQEGGWGTPGRWSSPCAGEWARDGSCCGAGPRGHGGGHRAEPASGFGERGGAARPARAGLPFPRGRQSLRGVRGADPLVSGRGALRGLAATLNKIANDVPLARVRSARQDSGSCACRRTSPGPRSCRGR